MIVSGRYHFCRWVPVSARNAIWRVLRHNLIADGIQTCDIGIGLQDSMAPRACALICCQLRIVEAAVREITVIIIPRCLINKISALRLIGAQRIVLTNQQIPHIITGGENGDRNFIKRLA